MILLNGNVDIDIIIDYVDDVEELRTYFWEAIDDCSSKPEGCPTKEEVKNMSKEDMLRYYWSLDFRDWKEQKLIQYMLSEMNVLYDRIKRDEED